MERLKYQFSQPFSGRSEKHLQVMSNYKVKSNLKTLNNGLKILIRASNSGLGSHRQLHNSLGHSN